jgi:hypothetical protein
MTRVTCARFREVATAGTGGRPAFTAFAADDASDGLQRRLLGIRGHPGTAASSRGGGGRTAAGPGYRRCSGRTQRGRHGDRERVAGTTASAVRFLGIIDDFRAMAEALGRTPPASRFSADMSRHAYYGTSERISRHDQEFAKEL